MRSRRPRDAQRRKVYDAEIEAGLKRGTPRFEYISDVRDYVLKVRTNGYLRRRYEHSLQPPIDVQDGGNRAARATGNVSRIRLPRWAWSEYIVLHELAHVITEREYGILNTAWHGREYCEILLDLVRFMLGRDQHDELKRRYKELGVKFRPKKTSAPMSDERRAKLSETLTRARQIKSQNQQQETANA